MKTSLACIFIFIQLFEAHEDLVFRQLSEHQVLELSCPPQPDHRGLTGLYLYHRSSHGQTTLLSMSEGYGLSVSPEHRDRLELHGGLGSPQINVSMTQLQQGDMGQYTCVVSLRDQNNSDQTNTKAQKVFLLVEGSGRSCHCSPQYPPLLLTLSAAVGLILLILSWLVIEKCVRLRRHHRPQPPAPIYEEMTSKQQSAGSPQNNPEAPSAPEEEVRFPVYANPNIRQQQDNYYACPRQLALRA